MNIEAWCNWFTRGSDKAEFVGSSPIASTKVEIEGSTPSLWTNIEMWCNWFTRHSDKVEFGGSSPSISTKRYIQQL